MKLLLNLVALSVFVPFSVYADNAANAFANRCKTLSKSFKPDSKTTVLLAEYLPKGSNVTDLSPAPECAFVGPTLADICRLRLNLTTSSRSNVIFETWLPSGWETKGKRFMMMGNGGLRGCIQFDEMNYFSTLGFATAGSNTGHDGNSGFPFYNNPEVVEDFAYRALLKSTKIGKKAIDHFYQTAVKKSYFLGCSSGGRQALKAAQDFPEEYDGIIAAAPAIEWNNCMSSFGYYWKFVANQQNPLTPEQWATWQAEVINQCDLIDGVADGVIEDPRKCKPRPESMLCAPGQSWSTNSKCFTADQVTFLRGFYEPMYGKQGNWLYQGYVPGDEAISALWFNRSGAPQLTVDWFKWAVLNDPNWTVEKDLDLDAIEYSRALDLYNISTYKADLSKLRASGHKLIHYHGLTDGGIGYEGSDRYYESVVRRMGLPSSELDKFYRYFPVPGMRHCAIPGPGSWYVGGASQYGGLPTGAHNFIDPEGGVVMSMVKWVEKGIAPETILGRGVAENGTFTSSKNHCKWPKKSAYVGGDASKKTAWTCK